MVDLVWLIPALPLAGFLLLLAVRPAGSASRSPAGSPPPWWAARSSSPWSCSSACATEPEHTSHRRSCSPGSRPGGFHVDVGFLLDPLSMAMVPVHHRRRRADPPVLDRLHARRPRASPSSSLYLNLFVFSMLMLVLGNNLLLTFLGWEGVGACSYFLISFWFEKRRPTPSPARRPSSPTASVTGASWSASSSPSSPFGTINYTQFLPGVAGRRPPTTATVIVAAAVHRRRRQVGPAPAVRLAARRHGRPDAGLGAHPRRHHGHRRRLPAWCASTRCSPRLADWVPDADRLDRGASPRCSPPPSPSPRTTSRRCWPTRRSASSATCSWPSASGGYVGRHLPHDHPRLLQGAAVPRRRLGHPRHGRRAGHAPHGRAAQAACRSPRSRSSSAGWPSPACRRSPASGRRTRSSPTPCTRTRRSTLVGLFTALLTAFYMSRQVFLVFFGEARWNDPIEPSTREAHSDAEAAAEASRGADAPRPPRCAVDDGPQPPRGPPPRVAWTMTVPLVVLAVLRRDRPGSSTCRSPTARSSSRTGSSRSTGRYGADVDYSNATIVAAARRSPPSSPSPASASPTSSTERRKLPAVEFEQPLFLHGWYYDWPSRAFMGGPGPQRASTPSPGSTARHRRRGQRRRARSPADAGSMRAPRPDRLRAHLRARRRRSARSC